MRCRVMETIETASGAAARLLQKSFRALCVVPESNKSQPIRRDKTLPKNLKQPAGRGQADTHPSAKYNR